MVVYPSKAIGQNEIGSSIKDIHTGGGRRGKPKCGQKWARGDFSASGRPHFTQHVGQEDSVTTLACKLCNFFCIHYITQGINAGIRRPARPPTRTTTVCSVCCCSMLPSLNYPRQLALMAAMTNILTSSCTHARWDIMPRCRHHQQSALVIECSW